MNRYRQDRLEPEMKNHERDEDAGVQRINDQLHFVHHVKDEQGKVVTLSPDR